MVGSSIACSTPRSRSAPSVLAGTTPSWKARMTLPCPASSVGTEGAAVAASSGLAPADTGAKSAAVPVVRTATSAARRRVGRSIVVNLRSESLSVPTTRARDGYRQPSSSGQVSPGSLCFSLAHGCRLVLILPAPPRQSSTPRARRTVSRRPCTSLPVKPQRQAGPCRRSSLNRPGLVTVSRCCLHWSRSMGGVTFRRRPGWGLPIRSGRRRLGPLTSRG